MGKLPDDRWSKRGVLIAFDLLIAAAIIAAAYLGFYH
jgi:hypothetical protein